ncbi:MAG: cupin domain-containing protein [Stellaceae bacterium]
MGGTALHRTDAKLYAYDMLARPWRELSQPGLYQKTVREDQENGLYLGLIAFDAQTRSGLHQHQATATSYFLEGSLHDYSGAAAAGQVGVNLKGATHDAIAYERCVLAGRLEGPVSYAESAGALRRLHAGAYQAPIVNAAPEVPPEINISLEALPMLATAIAGLARRAVFDYHGTGTERRLVELRLLPGTTMPAHRGSALVEWFLLGGEARLNGIPATGGSFVVIEPGIELAIASSYGARLLAWSEGPIAWADGSARPDLYGF